MTRPTRLVGALMLGVAAAACSGDPTDANVEPPHVQASPMTSAPTPPADLKVACMEPNGSFGGTTCPVITWRGATYWAFSHMDNRSAMTIVAYDAAGKVRGQLERIGARYVSEITVDEAGSLVTLKGQAGLTISFTFSELRSLAP